METLTELIIEGDLDSIKEMGIKKSDDGYLLFACEEGKLDIVKYFIEELKVDPTYDQNSPIRGAAQRGKLEVVKYLLNIKEIGPTDKEGGALFSAAHNGKLEIVKALLEHSTFPDKVIMDSIVSALIFGHEETAIYILDNNKQVLPKLEEFLSDELTARRNLRMYSTHVPYVKAYLNRYRIESRDSLINEVLDERS